MEFREVVRRRGMVRRYDERPLPPEVVERILAHALRAPSAGFSQGSGLLVLEAPEDIARFRAATTPDEGPESWLCADVRAPLVVVVHSNKDIYLDRYARPDKGWEDRSEARWPAPYWDIDAGFAALLMLLTAVDERLGACFFGLPPARIDAYREAFGVPAAFNPIGAVSVGYPAQAPPDLAARRRPANEIVHRGRWAAVPTQ